MARVCQDLKSMSNVRILTEKEKEVLAALRVPLYVDLESLGNLIGGHFRNSRRWIAGTNICQIHYIHQGWRDNIHVGPEIREYMDKGGLLYDNDDCVGEGMFWPISK